jgi:hypothetical protein
MLLIALLALIATVKCAPRKTTPNEPKEGLRFDPLPMYKYPSGATGSLERDFETGEKGVLIKKL